MDKLRFCITVLFSSVAVHDSISTKNIIVSIFIGVISYSHNEVCLESLHIAITSDISSQCYVASKEDETLEFFLNHLIKGSIKNYVK